MKTKKRNKQKRGAAYQYQEQLAAELGISIELVQKAAQPMSTDIFDTAGLGHEMADTFIDMVVDESRLLKEARVHRTSKRSGDIPKLNIHGYVTRKASELSSGTETRRVTQTNLEYNTRKTRSLFDISRETEEDNIEGPGFRTKVLGMFTKAIMNDMETLAIEGDVSQVGSDDYSELVSTNDGWNVLTTLGQGAHIVSAGAKRASWKLLKKMLKNLPTKYRGDGAALEQFRWIMSPNVLLDLQEEAAERGTDLGDARFNGKGEFAPLGITPLVVPKLPEDLAVSGTQSTGTFIWLAVPDNFIFIIQRFLMWDMEEIPRGDKIEVTAYMRTDFLVEDTDAVVKATNIVVDDDVARYGAA